MKIARVLPALLLIAGLTGCAVLSQPERVATVADAANAALEDGEGWWYTRFHLERPAGEPVRWYLGTLVAGEIVAPVMQAHTQDIRIWRIHRRAGSDDLGHVFSFVFYASPQAAGRINAAFSRHPAVARLEQQGHLRKLTVEDTTRIKRPGIGDTSDADWPELVQLTWPALAMGASRMWLDMVSEIARTTEPGADLVTRYQAVDAEVTRLWQQQGQHVVLHHLSAIYGYAPVLIRY